MFSGLEINVFLSFFDGCKVCQRSFFLFTGKTLSPYKCERFSYKSKCSENGLFVLIKLQKIVIGTLCLLFFLPEKRKI